MRNTVKSKMIFPGLLLAALSVLGTGVYAQASMPEVSTKPHVYIDVNNATVKDVYDVKDNLMSFQYVDKSGLDKEITLTIYNWKSELVMTYVLDKALGLNQYSISLEDAGIDLGKGEIYRCVLRDAVQNECLWSIHANKTQVSEIKASIIAKPLDVDCSKMRRESVIEYYSDVKGGSGPYQLNWYVLNESSTKLLYQPREAAADEKSSSMITVDKPLNYKVMLNVTDGCGNTAQKMISVTCQNNKKKINTIFVEFLPPPVRKTVPAKELVE